VPTIEQLLPLLGIASREEGKPLCEGFCDTMEPLTTEVLALLDAEGAYSLHLLTNLLYLLHLLHLLHLPHLLHVLPHLPH